MFLTGIVKMLFIHKIKRNVVIYNFTIFSWQTIYKLSRTVVNERIRLVNFKFTGVWVNYHVHIKGTALLLFTCWHSLHKMFESWKHEKACEKIRKNLLNCLLESECYKVVRLHSYPAEILNFFSLCKVSNTINYNRAWRNVKDYVHSICVTDFPGLVASFQ